MSYFNKNNAFLYLTKTQKSNLLTHIKLFIKKHVNMHAQNILYEFIEEENYYLQVGNTHFEWIFEYFEQDEFLNELKNYINYLLNEIEQKERQKPFLEEQKQKAKKIRKQAQEFKMSKQPPTKKQLYYYEKLCKTYKLLPKDLTDLSRLDLRKMIDEILVANSYQSNTLS